MPITKILVPISKSETCCTVMDKVKTALLNNSESMQIVNTYLYEAKFIKGVDELIEYSNKIVTLVNEK